MNDSDVPRARRGRPRAQSVDAALKAATLELLGEVGYGQLTIDGVAGRAGVSRNAVYRRYRSKAELIFDVVFPSVEHSVLPDTGSLVGDLCAALVMFTDDFRRVEASRATGGLIADVQNDVDLRTRFRERVEAVADTAFGAVIDRALARGELDKAIPVPPLLHMLIGAALYRALVVDGGPEPVAEALRQLVASKPAEAQSPDDGGGDAKRG
ncbi:TetR/AcrR family transcriptional regulator [Streptomyces sp. bgisy031]|uniref:TetR/AcrR family transcriptional regulator n=1 Tax=Streptomyces sp. bgisy031 TaxID=3413772 RepID=UPI003D721D9E